MTRFRQLGLTLTEVTMALGVVSALGAVSVPIYGNHVEQGRVIETTNEISRIEAAIERYRFDHGDEPESLAEVFEPAPRDAWGQPFQYRRVEAEAADLESRIKLNNDFELFSLGPDGDPGRSLVDDPAQDNVVRAMNGGYVGTVEAFPYKGQGTL